MLLRSSSVQLCLQLADQMGHGRLGIPQLNGSFAKAAALHRGQQRPQLAIIHRNLAFDVLHNYFKFIFQYITKCVAFQWDFCEFPVNSMIFSVNSLFLMGSSIRVISGVMKKMIPYI